MPNYAIFGVQEEVIIVLLLSFFAGMAYWQLSPFYPAFLQGHGLDKWYIGLMMSTYAVSGLISSYFTGHYLLRKNQRLRFVLYGSACIVSTLWILTQYRFAT